MTKELSGNTNLSHYRILQKIGAGGMGEVYLAEDTRLRRKAALKILPESIASDKERQRRFEQEACAASALNHPNILTIYEFGETDGVHFLAAEFVEGETLREKLLRAIVSLDEALDIAQQTALALSAAHSAGIVHRDIKPENVMLRSDGIVKVLDFGLAKLTEQSPPDPVDTGFPTSIKTDPGTVIGTAIYMSPEQARGLQVDARTDIFSLGVVLYEMVAGRLPFDGSTASEVMASMLGEKVPPPLARYARNVPDELERIVSKALRKAREQRYQTIKDLRLDLQSLKEQLEFEAKLERSIPPRRAGLLDEDSAATAPGVVRTTGSIREIVTEIKRHKTGAGLAFVTLIIGLAVAGYFYSSPVGKAAIDSVAVLPLANVTGDPNTEYLSDGITESIINSLSQLPNFKVMSRNSVFHYKGKAIDAQAIAKELQVQAVLTGRVSQRGDSLSINVELINAQDNSQLWGQQYNRRLADVFAVQEEIAREISEKLRLKLTSTEQKQLAKRPTENIKAYQYYMQGRSYTQRRTREDLLAAISYCEKAIAEDPNYALAYAGLADAYANLGIRGYIAPVEGRRKMEEGARKALALDENLAEAHVAQGMVHTVWAPFNFSLGDAELRRAIEFNPSLALAHQMLGFSYVRQGRLDESVAEFLKARELDPLSSINTRALSAAYLLKREYSRAFELLRQANELGPAFSVPFEIGVYIQNRLFSEALAELELAKRERKNDPTLIYGTGMVYAARGERAEALQIIKELEAMSGTSLSQALWIAKIYATLNDRELALTWLDRGLDAGALGVFYKDEPVWDPIRKDPRFADLLRRIGVPE